MVRGLGEDAAESGAAPRTIDEVLLFGGQDGGQVSPIMPALGLRILPAPPGGEVLVAGSLEAVPAGAALLQH